MSPLFPSHRHAYTHASPTIRSCILVCSYLSVAFVRRSLDILVVSGPRHTPPLWNAVSAPAPAQAMDRWPSTPDPQVRVRWAPHTLAHSIPILPLNPPYLRAYRAVSPYSSSRYIIIRPYSPDARAPEGPPSRARLHRIDRILPAPPSTGVALPITYPYLDYISSVFVLPRGRQKGT
ncbi:hypothetical protein BV20DRAFT_66158 [Pilatotrama ljubarskyi]|nr:hypothetical protein BV20DRAFT_66158 [Pilatotrama ljubarskyi]